MNEPDPIKALQRAANEIQLVKPTPTHQLALYLVQSVQRYLDMAQTAAQLKDGRDLAQLFALYFKRRKAELRDSNALRAMQLRTERKLGAMLRDTPRENGKRTDATSALDGTRLQGLQDELGIDHHASLHWQHLAEIDRQDFEFWLEEQQKDGRELTSSAALEYWRKHYGPPPLVHEPVDGIPADAPEPPDDDEVNGEYEHANFGLNLQIAIQEFDQAFTEIMSLTAEKAVLELCQEQREKIAMLQAEMK